MNIYQDFDTEENTTGNGNKLNKPIKQEKLQKKNTFIYESFSDRMKKIKVRLTNNLENDISFIKVDKEENFKISENESNFLIMFNREKVLNSTQEFTQFYNQIKPFIGSYLLIIHNSNKIIKIFSSTIEENIKIDSEDPNKKENLYNHRNYSFLKSVLEVMIGFIKDIREDASEVFISEILPNLIKLLANSENIEIIDKTFSVFVNIFKFLHKNIQKNFNKFFLIFSELIFSKNKTIRKFSSESLCFFIKNLDNKELSECLKIIFEIFNSPELFFKLNDDNEIEKEKDETRMDICNENLNKNSSGILELIEFKSQQFLSSKKFIHHIISNSKYQTTLYLFMIDSISDLFFEVLIGVNRNLSIRADLFLEKIFFCKIDDSYLKIIKDITIIDTCIKLFSYVSENQRKSVIALFNYYLLFFFPEKNVSYPKLNLESLNNQINIFDFTKNENSLKAEIYSFIFIKEILLKFYNKLNFRKDKCVHVSYFVAFFIKLQNSSNLNYVGKLFTIDILTILLKFYPEEFIHQYKKQESSNELLKYENKADTYLLSYFCTNLKLYQIYKELVFQLILEKKKFIAEKIYDNHDYDGSYNVECVTYVIENILNQIKMENISQILELITTYEKLVSYDKKNPSLVFNYKFIDLKLHNEHNKKIIQDYIENESNQFKLIKSDTVMNVEKYLKIYSNIILITFIKDEVTLTSNFINNTIEYLINILENDKSGETELKITEGINNSDYFSLLFSEFNNSNIFYLSKRTSILNLIDSLLTLFPLKENKLLSKLFDLMIKNYTNGIVFKILNQLIDQDKDLHSHFEFSIDQNFLLKTCKVLLVNNNKYKSDYLKLIYKLYFNDTKNNFLINEIFDVMQDTLGIVFDYNNDKKYSFNLEVLLSKLESLIINDNKNIYLYLFSLVYYFLIGSYWIRFTKTVWNVITKSIERFYTLLNSSEQIDRILVKQLKNEINKQTEDLLNYIHTFGTNEEFVSKYGQNSEIMNDFYLVFNNNEEVIKETDNMKQNLISLTFLTKEYELQGISLLYEGYLQAMQSYHLVLSSDNLENFVNFSIENLKINGGKNNWMDLILPKENINLLSNSDETFYLYLFNNYVIDKENKTSVISKKFVEAILLVLSKSDLCELKSKFLLKYILFEHIIVSKSQLVQKYSVSILINLENKLKPFKNLLDSVIENTAVHERLYNLDNIKTDNNNLIKQEERSVLVPLLIRLYYSKYFYISNDNKKMRTKHKINLVSFFIQLNENEFKEYVKIIFEPLSLAFSEYESISSDNKTKDDKCLVFLEDSESNIGKLKKYFSEGIKYYNFNLKSYKRIIHILTLNLKQITKLFNSSACFITYLIKNLLLFVKNLNNFLKNFEKQKEDGKILFYDSFKEVLNNYKVENTKYYNYFNHDELSNYINFIQKNVKDLKKQSFLLLKNIMFKFYNKNVLASNITKEICMDYLHLDENFSFPSKINSMLAFILSLSKNPHLHFIFVENKILFVKILEILRHPLLENDMMKTLLQFLDNILLPYYNIKIEQSRDEFISKFKKKNNKEMIVDDEAADMEVYDNEDDGENEDDDEVVIQELKFDDEEEKFELDDEIVMQNEKLLIVANFEVINDNLLYLVKNEKVKFTIRDISTKKILEILVYLWNMFDVKLQENLKKNAMIDLLNFLVKLLKIDRKIYKYENQDTLGDILKICHILLRIHSENKNEFNYNTFLSLIYRIHEKDSNNRLILSLLIQEFYDYYSNFSDINFKEILNLISNLNLLKSAKNNNKLTLDSNDDHSKLDVDNTIDKMNLITYNFISQFKFYHLEPLIYQLLIFTKSDDFSLQTISVLKLKLIFESYQENSNDNLINLFDLESNDLESLSFKRLAEFLYSSLDEKGKSMNLSFSKIVLEIISSLNSLIKNDGENYKYYEIICSDLYKINLENSDYNIFEALLNIKYDIRADAIKTVKTFITADQNKISYFSLKKLIIPIIKNFLSPLTYINKGISGYTASKIEKSLELLLNESVETISLICQMLSKDSKDMKEFLMFFYDQIEKINKKPESYTNVNEEFNKDFFINYLYKGLTKVIESITALQNYKFDFLTSFNSIMKNLMLEYNKENLKSPELAGDIQKNSNSNRELFKRAFENLNNEYNNNRSDKRADEILNLLKNNIYKTLKNILIDNRKKEKGRHYYIRNYAIRPFLQLVKLLDPYQIKYELIQLNYELVNNVKNRELQVREKAREGIKVLYESFGIFISSMIFDELKMQLHSGYQRYIMSFTANFVINILNNNANNEDVRTVLDFSSFLIMPIILDELFGEIAEEKEIEQLVNKYKEAKQTKSYNSLFILCSKTNLKNAIVNIVYPIYSYLINRDNDVSVFTKLNEAINHMIKGFKNNTELNFEDILNYSNGLIKMGIDINIKNSREVHETKITIKGGNNDYMDKRKSYQQQRNELFTLQVGAINGKNYNLEISDKFLINKNEVILSNLFTSLGLELFSISIKKKLFDFNSLNEMGEKENTSQCISSLLQNVILCLEISNTNTLSKSLKILIKLFDNKLFIIKKNLRKIIKHLFKNLNIMNTQEITLSQTILSSIGDILNKFKYTKISDNKLKVLLNFLKLNANNGQIKPYIYSCFLSVIKRKILHPSIYDMINFIQENYITAFEENTLIVCSNILVEFLKNYPIEDTRTISHLNFYLINLESSTRKCVINSLKMIYKLFEEFYEKDKKDFMNGIIDFTILKLITLLTNTTDGEIKILINSNIKKIFDILEVNHKEKGENYINKILEWLKLENNSERSMVKLSLNFLSIICNNYKDSVEKKGILIRDLLISRIESEISNFEGELEDKLENEQYTNIQNKNDKELDKIFKRDNYEENQNENELTILDIKFDNWDILYLCLTIIEKLNKNYTNIMKNLIKKSFDLFNLVVKCLKHPHLFIKNISMRLLNFMFDENPNIYIYLEDDKVCAEFLFTNFKFFILNPEISQKLSEVTINNTLMLIQNLSKGNTNFCTFYSYEFICRLYIESKSHLSSSENSVVIFNRIFNLFDGLILQISPENLKFYLDPILSLCHRVINHRLIEVALKNRANKIMDLLKEKLEAELVANKYKEIKDNINFLKRKRKMGKIEKSLGKSKE